MNSATFWDKAAAKYATDPINDMAGYTKTLDIIKDLLQPHHRVAEIGCGTGSTALELAPLVDSYIGTDISKNMIDIATTKRDGTDLQHLSFRVAGAADLPETKQDVILALNLLHLLPDVEGTVSAIYDALPSGGYFIAKTGLLRDGAWYLRPMIAVMRAIGKAPYVSRLGKNELLTLLHNAGFNVTETVSQPGVAPRIFTVAQKP